MLYIKLDESMNLRITVNEPIYRGEHMSKKIVYLVPERVGEIALETAAVYLSYIRADGTADIVLLKRQEEKYKEKYFQYVLPVTTSLSRFPGEVCTWLQIYSGPAHCPAIVKSGECMLNILASTNMDEYITDRNLSLIYGMQKTMEEKAEAMKAEIGQMGEAMEAGLNGKADGLLLDAEADSLQLYATVTTTDEESGEAVTEQIPLGEPVVLGPGEG